MNKRYFNNIFSLLFNYIDISMIIKAIHVIINKNQLSMIMTIDVLAGLTRLYNLIMY